MTAWGIWLIIFGLTIIIVTKLIATGATTRIPYGQSKPVSKITSSSLFFRVFTCVLLTVKSLDIKLLYQ